MRIQKLLKTLTSQMSLLMSKVIFQLSIILNSLETLSEEALLMKETLMPKSLKKADVELVCFVS